MAYNILQEHFSYEILFSLINMKDIDYNLKAKFLKLLQFLHIDRDPFNKLDVPNLTRIWENIEPPDKAKIISTENTVPTSILQIKAFVLKFIKGTKGVQSVHEYEKNLMTQEILKCTLFMVSYGFYSSHKELKELEEPLITLLDGTNDIYQKQDEDEIKIMNMSKGNFNHRDQGFKKTEHDIIPVCKGIICQILVKISDIEIDKKMTKFLGFFKIELEEN